jgi:UPF0755 protein
VSRSPKAGRRRSRPRRRRSRRTGLWVVLGASLVGLCLPTMVLLLWATRPGPGSTDPVAIDWAGAAGPGEAADAVARQGLTSSPRLLAIYLRAVGGWDRIAPGPHLLRGDLSPREIVQRLTRSAARPEASVVIPEGWNHLQIADRLEERGVCSAGAFRAAVTAPALLAELDIAGSSAEGYLFPATYRLRVDSDPREVVRRLVAELRQRFARLQRDNAASLARLRQRHAFSERDLITVASIVEKEARRDDERALVASVYYNRLTDPEFVPAGMLQSDPTAAYGCLVAPAPIPSCAGSAGRVTPAMLRDASNPYNTYRRPGLPPGPIANPGELSIAAALAPAQTDYLFFVAERDGRHRFSRTFEEHRRAIQGELAP